jgi:hypothetical protein
LFGLAAILGLVLLLMKKHKKRQANRKSELQGEHIIRNPNFSGDQDGGGAPMMSQKYVPLEELNADQAKQEMPAGPVDPVELEDSECNRGKG